MTTAHAAPPAAAPRPLTFADASGDANAINDNGDHDTAPIEGVPTGPASIASNDITSLTIAATGSMATRRAGRRSVRYFQCTGFTATITLAAPPGNETTFYRVITRRVPWATDEDEHFNLQYRHALGADTPETLLRYVKVDKIKGRSTATLPLRPPTVSGNKITFVVTAADIAKTGERLGALDLTRIEANVSSAVDRFNVPIWDQLVGDPKAVWRVCPA